MIEAVFCAVSTEKQINEAVSKMRTAGIDPSSLAISTRLQEVDLIACPQSQLNLSIKRGIAYGGIVGALIGVAMVLYMGSIPTFWGALSLVAWEAFGWSLFGMIVGSGGLLGRPKYSAHVIHHLEDAIRKGKILVSIEVADRSELRQAAATLYEAGAADMHEAAA